ncbi:MAG: 23S rRNA (adenine(2503)-C(2))-methyltransferase RlmN [Planctomycetota bacterium]
MNSTPVNSEPVGERAPSYWSQPEPREPGSPAGAAPAPHLLDLPPSEARRAVADWLIAANQPSYRAAQIVDHVFGRRCGAPQRMTNLPGDLRTRLANTLLRDVLSIAEIQVSRDGTRKYRLQLGDGAIVEAVWIPADDRGTLCMSSQAGCPAGCTFCATAASGFRRNLRPSEMVSQWLLVGDDLRREARGEVTQVVFMGMGEPLFNYDSLSVTLRLLTEPAGFAFSPRRITVSTVGVPRRMEQLCAEFPQVRLALSLHSARDETREQIVPMNRRFGVGALRECLRSLGDRLRRVTLEYVLLVGVNDSPDEARALARFASECAGHVNLLPFHPYPGARYSPTPPERLRTFKRQVEDEYSGSVTIRVSRGLDIAGACGQLALRTTPPQS